ncbi:hypothetical protein K7X08_000390 [Anisodus acutangulus]|uniref:PRA1 family protein n=1 Tax=Anisodus acutangulus TaxID=402998 RepID=A0A9Q1RE24_9SOLA|nr:hypothetical protein K7X08_000390 [Anisodus acutangulus]
MENLFCKRFFWECKMVPRVAIRFLLTSESMPPMDTTSANAAGSLFPPKDMSDDPFTLLTGWLFLYLFRPSDPPLVIFGRQFSERETLGVLIVSSVVVIFLTSVGAVLVSALMIGLAIVCTHAAFRAPEDLFLDDPQESPATGFLSFLTGGGAANAASVTVTPPVAARKGWRVTSTELYDRGDHHDNQDEVGNARRARLGGTDVYLVIGNQPEGGGARHEVENRVVPRDCRQDPALCKDGKVDVAVEILNQLSNKGCSSVPITYNTVIDGLSKVGKTELAIELLNEMREKGLQPDIITYSSLVADLSREGKVDEAIKFFHDLAGLDVRPNAITDNAIMLGLCKARQTDRAIDFLAYMISKGCKPTESTYTNSN